MSKKQVWSEDGTLKRCSKCDAMKPPDSFPRRKLKSGGFGLHSWCQPCISAKALIDINARYANDPEWRAKKLARDREVGMKKRVAHRAEHPRVFLTPEERVERERASWRKYAAGKGRENNRTHSRNYRALKKKQAEGEPITKEVWRRILAEHGGKCAYCKVETPYLEMDHVVPLTRGGKHSVDNVVPACRACNTSKNDQLLGTEWTPPTEPQLEVLAIHGGRRAWKLTDEQVAEIRARRAAGEKGRALATEYGVHEQHITDIYRGKVRVLKT